MSDIAKRLRDYTPCLDPATAICCRRSVDEAADTIDDLVAALKSSALALDEAATLLASKGLQGCGSIMSAHADRARAAITKAEAS